MWPESEEQPTPLRSGLTTGSCATACCVAAARALLANKTSDKVTITLPRGKEVDMEITSFSRLENGALRAATIKDAGDDPDATHGATVFVELRLSETPGVRFSAAQGVGTVTREGLLLDVGEPAINPVPRQMMLQHLEGLAHVHNYSGGFEVAVGVENGEQIAQKTMNPRLGIVGGLSILGTTGIVRPYSCAAYIASIRQGIDVASTNGAQHIAASTGSSSEAAIAAYYQLPEMALIEMGDFVGPLMKHLKKGQVAKLSICGGFGKISKLANRHLDLNSRKSDIDFQQLANALAELGADKQMQAAALEANTSIEVLKHAQAAGLPLADHLCRQAQAFACHVIGPGTEVEVWAINRRGEFVGNSLPGGLGV